jgi:CarD family transcriptional regulator
MTPPRASSAAEAVSFDPRCGEAREGLKEMTTKVKTTKRPISKAQAKRPAKRSAAPSASRTRTASARKSAPARAKAPAPKSVSRPAKSSAAKGKASAKPAAKAGKPAKPVLRKPAPARPHAPAKHAPAKPDHAPARPAKTAPKAPVPVQQKPAVAAPSAGATKRQPEAPPKPASPEVKPLPQGKGLSGAAKTAAAALKARIPANDGVRKLPERPVGPEREPFIEGDFVVYPTHGVGRVVAIETQQIAGISLPLIVITFDKDRMTLRVPVAKAHNSGLRKLSSRKVMDTALATLKGRSRVKRTMWSRRAQEYEAKINSGDPVSIAEVVRDLHRGSDQPDQSYSERQIYQAALDRLARELAAVERIDEEAAAQRLEEMLKAA